MLIDIGLSTNLVLSQRELLAQRSAASNRLNGLFRLIFFGSGALASAIAGAAYATGGWAYVCAIQLAFLAGGASVYLSTTRLWTAFTRQIDKRRTTTALKQLSDSELKDLGYPNAADTHEESAR